MDRSRTESDPYETMQDTFPQFDSDEVGYVHEDDDGAPVEEDPRGR